MTTELQQEPMREIAYWQDGYFIADDDAASQGEIMDSVNAFGSEHTLLLVPVLADRDAMQVLVNAELESKRITEEVTV